MNRQLIDPLLQPFELKKQFQAGGLAGALGGKR